jgi:hypothetical protein
MSGSLSLGDLEPRVRDRLIAGVAGVLLRSPWRRRRHWSRIVVAVTEESPGVELRGAFAERMRREGLAHFAHEVVARRVPPDHVLVYAVIDRLEIAGHALWTVPLLAELGRIAPTSRVAP